MISVVRKFNGGRNYSPNLKFGGIIQSLKMKDTVQIYDMTKLGIKYSFYQLNGLGLTNNLQVCPVFRHFVRDSRVTLSLYFTFSRNDREKSSIAQLSVRTGNGRNDHIFKALYSHNRIRTETWLTNGIT